MIQIVKTKEIFANENNPRVIKDEKFRKLVQSIKDFPQMLNLRPIVVNDEMVVLGGNMRLRAVQEELKNWTNVRRMAWDQWNFKYKKDAEKFVTLFNLKWAK